MLNELMRRRNELVQKMLKLVNMLLIAGFFDAVWFIYYHPKTEVFSGSYAGLLLYFMYCCLYVMYTKIYDGFLVLSSRIYELICGQALSALIADLLMFIVIWLTMGSFPNVLPLAGTFVVQFLTSTIWSVLVHRWYFSSHSAQKVVFIKDGDYDVEEMMEERSFKKCFETVAVMTPRELIESNFEVLKHASTVFVCCPAGADRNTIVSTCNRRGKGVYIIPEPEDIMLHGAKQVHLFHSAMMRVSRSEQYLGYEFTKRCIDIFVSGVALLIFSPVMIGIGIAIKLDDGGPVFYRQKRLTIHGRCFEIMKFRSMRVDAEKDGVVRLSSGENDDRITKVGRFIRKTRLDELPQLINILKGDMSIVGPRPERPELTELYSKEYPQFTQRLRVKAGLTGYAQVYGKYNSTPLNKLLMDMVYIEHRNLWEDIQIMFATVKVIFMPDSTEGVSAEQTTALKNK